MAQFKSLNVLGNVSVLGSVAANNVELNTLNVNSEIVLKSGKSIKDSNGNYFIQDGGTMMVFGDPAVPSLFRGVRYIGAPSSSNSEAYTTGTNGQVLTTNGESIYWGDLNLTQDEATSSAAGLMSAADKTKLDGIQASADAVSFTSKLTSGTEIGTITINGTETKIYCEKGGAVGEFLPLSGGTMTGPIVYDSTSGNNKSSNYLSAGGGYATGSGRLGLKIVALDQSDAQMGLGVDLTGGPYELTVATSRSANTGTSKIVFATHTTGTTAYKTLATLSASGAENPTATFNVVGKIQANTFSNYNNSTMLYSSGNNGNSNEGTLYIGSSAATPFFNQIDDVFRYFSLLHF